MADPAGFNGSLPVTQLGTWSLQGGGGPGSDVNLASVGGTAVALGQAGMATSIPVAIASDQSNLTVAPVANFTVAAAAAFTVQSPGSFTVAPVASFTVVGSGNWTSVQGGTWTVAPVANFTVASPGSFTVAPVANFTVAATQVGSPWGVNLTQVSNTTFNIGQQVMTASLPVVIASNQTAVTVAPVANFTVVSPGSFTVAPVSNFTVAAAAAFTVQSPGSFTVAPVSNFTVAANLAAVLGAAIVTAGVAGAVGIGGLATTGAAVSGYPVMVGGRTQTAEIATAGNAQVAYIALDVVGKQIVLPYANKENMWRSNVSYTATTIVTIIGSQGAGTKQYITSMQIGATGTTPCRLTLNDTGTSVFVINAIANATVNGVPAVAYHFPVPLVANAAASTIVGTLSTLSTSVFVNAQGYFGA